MISGTPEVESRFDAGAAAVASPGPRVSVCMVTYKHEAFIEQAIESVFAQQTSFPIELVVGEDHSPDATAEKIRRYTGNARVSIRSRFNVHNMGMQANFEMTLKECHGDYIALLEGDDYWTDPAKLQRQVEFMDAHPEFAICFHPVDVLRDGRLEHDALTRAVGDVSDIRDLALGNYMHTCSVVYRARLFDGFPPSFRHASVVDFFLHMLNARFGRIGRLAQKMAVYRIHPGGVWSAQTNIDLKILSYLEDMIGCFDKEIDQLLIRRHQEIAFKSFLQRANEPDAEDRLKRCIRYGSTEFAERIAPMVRRARALDEHRVFRHLKRFL